MSVLTRPNQDDALRAQPGFGRFVWMTVFQCAATECGNKRASVIDGA